MNMAVTNNGSNFDSIKSNTLAGSRQIKQAVQGTFAQIQSSQNETNGGGDSSKMVAASLTGDGAQSTDPGVPQSTDQLLMQSRLTIAQGDDPKATSDSSRSSQQSADASAPVSSGNWSAETIAAFQAEDQLLMQGRTAIQQSQDPKWTADGSKVTSQATGAATTNNAQSTANPSVNASKVSLEKLALDQTYAAFRENSNMNTAMGANIGSMNVADSRYAGTWGSSSSVQNGTATSSGFGTVIDFTA